MNFLVLVQTVIISSVFGQQIPYYWDHQWRPVPRLMRPIRSNCQNRPESPIDIDLKRATEVKFANPLKTQNFFTSPSHITLINDGKTIKYVFESSCCMPRISGGALGNEIYVLDNIHFHWAQQDNFGSEHTLNGTRFPLEMHLVFFNEKYGNLNASVGKLDGLTVLGAFFQISKSASDRHLFNYLSTKTEIYKPGQVSFVATHTRDDVWSLFDAHRFSYVNYRGSFTNPRDDCKDMVEWNIALKTMKINPKQMDYFRKLLRNSSGDSLGPNWATIQPTQNRRLNLICSSADAHRYREFCKGKSSQ